MRNLILLELRKYFRVKTLVVGVIFIILSSLFTLNGNKITSTSVNEYQTRIIDELISKTEQNIEVLKLEVDRFRKKGDEATAIKIEEILKEDFNTLQLYIKEKNAKTKEDRLNLRIEKAETYLNIKNTTELSKDEIIRELEVNKAYKQSNIIPDDDKLTALTFAKKFPKNFNAFYLAILVIILSGDAVSNERGSTLIGYMCQPITKSKVILSKFISTIIAAVGIFTVYEAVIFLFIGALNGWGPINSLVEFGAQFTKGSSFPMYISDSQSFIPGNKFILYLLSYQALYIATIAAIGFLISVIFSKSATSTSISVGIILIIHTIVYKIKALPFFHKYIFISYGDISGLLTGGLSFEMNNINLSTSNALFSMIATIIVCYLISHILFTHQEIYS